MRTTHLRPPSLLLGLLIAASPATGADSLTLQLDLQPDKKYLFTNATRTQVAIMGDHLPQDVKMVDVLTNVLELRTHPADFLGGVTGVVELVDSRSKTVGAAFRPVDRESPLKPFIGARAILRQSEEGEVSISDIELPEDAPSMGERAFREVVMGNVYPIPEKRRELAIDDRFERRRERTISLQKVRVPVEQLERYILERTEPGKGMIKKETVIRPASKKQQQTVFGKGVAHMVYDVNAGIIVSSNDKMHMESKLRTPRGWITYVSNTKSEYRAEMRPPD